MKTATFTATVLSGHKQDAVEVPFDPAARWNSAPVSIRPGRRGLRVHAEIHGHGFETHVVSRSKKFWLLLSSEVEDKLSIKAGDTVSVALEPS